MADPHGTAPLLARVAEGALPPPLRGETLIAGLTATRVLHARIVDLRTSRSAPASVSADGLSAVG